MWERCMMDGIAESGCVRIDKSMVRESWLYEY